MVVPHAPGSSADGTVVRACRVDVLKQQGGTQEHRSDDVMTDIDAARTPGSSADGTVVNACRI